MNSDVPSAIPLSHSRPKLSLLYYVSMITMSCDRAA
jgi:hypothetical protein